MEWNSRLLKASMATLSRALRLRSVGPAFPRSMRVCAVGICDLPSSHVGLSVSRAPTSLVLAKFAPAVLRPRASAWVSAVRHLSTEAPTGEAEAKAERRKPMFLLLSGSKEPQPIQINLDERVIVGLEATMKVLEAELSKSVQGIVMALNDKGNYEIRWPKGADDDVATYILAHEYTAVEAGWEYQGAFSVGVKRVKMLSLASLLFTSIGGPLLVVGEANPTSMQWGLAVAIIFFGVSTTGLLHLITSPYVVALRRLADKSFEAETPLLTGGTVTTRFHPADITPSTAPFATFKAKGRSFFIHKELFIGDEAQTMLWELLGPQAVEDMYTAQLVKDPSDPDALYNYGRFLWLVKSDAPEAEKAIKQVLEMDPEDKGALELMEHIKTKTKPK